MGFTCTQLVCAAFWIIIAVLLNTLYQVGEFSLIYPKNVRQCRRIEGYHGCEDFAFFASNKDVYMSCDDRSWLKYHALGQNDNISTRIAKQKEQGKLYVLPSNNYDKAKPVTMKGFTSPDFHPLGIASMEDKSGKWLFVTDNTRDGEKVEIFKVHSQTDIELFSEFLFDAPLFEPFQMLNDIVVIPDSGGSFYVTVWLVKEPGTILNFIDVYLRRPVSYVLFCESPSKDFLSNPVPSNNADKSSVGWKCRRVVENLRMINGITRSHDSKRMYMAETTAKTMNVYDRDTITNELALVKKVSTMSGCDNLEMSQDGKTVYLGCHPKALTFQFHAAYPKAVVAPSRILKFVDNNSSADEMQVVMESTGEILSGSSLGIKVDDTLIVGSVHDDCYLLCDAEKL
eukprot:CAMPEP_0202688598 /NCGR_PEP_ID=MMETSP1385-20130828/4093_1 /ASSEMBLY_ACC=CAM_ASM_000861 /TAXON_ID=933848 /ORGANISM="Elphidium margaritaceum" /LENGTH=398 /DNA_ID=CAMNT_0049343613 /DNA_START=17 /DNA_END=1213 /DNA_ORIENTATION=-